MLDRVRQESFDPVGPFDPADRRLRMVAAIHGEQVTNRNFCKVVADFCRQFVREETDQFVIQAEQAFVDGQADGGGCERLADRIQDVRLVGGIVSQPGFFQYFTMLDNHDTMQILPLVGNGLQVGCERLVHSRRRLGTGKVDDGFAAACSQDGQQGKQEDAFHVILL